MAPTTPEPDPVKGHGSTPSARWPGAVRPPDSPGFEQSAKAWLFDLAPARWRYEDVLHKNPVELAHMVRLQLEADIAAMQTGLRSLRDSLMPHKATLGGHGAHPDTAAVYAREQAWACAMRDQVKLIEDALIVVCRSARRQRAKGACRRPPLPSPRPAVE
ncbi:hypothetical protein NGB36_21345 [Streptomyces sp. RB6PN25]|uniref:Transposase n=1 Tax=Streptomyces humicola TaxID=2953240 RepID=A0ABT1PZI5_9ACTN|nr:hypothetical protein [Streptomyces humicola]MCQ4083081.1 hypothetical protein [Streptomyces humicola]